MIARRLLLLLALAAMSGCSLPRWPVAGTMTAPYGLRFSGMRPAVHRGVDLDVPRGTPVRAMSDARVRFAGIMAGYGNVVWLEHGGSILTVYAHLSEIRVAAGSLVQGGTVLGLSGASGNANGPHLHFEVWRRGRPVDPVPLLGRKPSA